MFVLATDVRKITGVQFTGRHAWPDEQTNAARAWAREPSDETLKDLKETQRASATGLAELQGLWRFSYTTDGGFGLLDDFLPYIKKVNGIEGGEGQINKQPGTRNQYYFILLVKGKISSDGPVFGEYLLTDALPESARKKVIMPSPLSLALASKSVSYPKLSDLIYDYSDIQRKDVQALAKDYDYVQLNESFATDPRFIHRVTKDVIKVFENCLDRTFKGFPKRSAIYFHAGNASHLVPVALNSKVTDVGFDFNTPASEIDTTIDKNLILGLQNVTRKLPEDRLEDQPKHIARQTSYALARLRVADKAEIFLGQSQGSDGLQTYSQAIRLDENLFKAFKILRGGSV